MDGRDDQAMRLHLDAVAADHRRVLREAGDGTVVVGTFGADGLVQRTFDAADVSVAADGLAIALPDGTLERIPYVGPGSSPVLPELHPSGRWERYEPAARAALRAMGARTDQVVIEEDGEGYAMPRWGVRIAASGLWPQRGVGVAWDETTDLRVVGGVLRIATADRALTLRAA